MILHPRPNQKVRIHYAEKWRSVLPWHGRIGTVAIIGRGPGPRNVGVEIYKKIIVFPRGNLVAVKT